MQKGIRYAIYETWEGFILHRIWWTYAWQDIKLRYRRSMIGPFWITISMAVTIIVLGLLYGALFKLPLEQFIPFLTIGFIFWNLMSGLIADGCQTFIENAGYLLQTRLPLTVYVYKIVSRNVILFAHNIVIYFFVAFFFKIIPGLNFWMVLIGLLLIIINGIWAGLILGILCTRFRDLTQIVNSILQVSFFMTPILWDPNLIERKRAFVVHYNPFFHIIELVRAPLLGRDVSLLSLMVVLGITLAGFIMSMLLYSRFGKRVAYWV